MSPFEPFLPLTLRRRLIDEPPADWAGRPDDRNGAVLFVDVSGFTPLSERLAGLGREGAERLTRILNEFYGTLVGIVEALGGDVMGYAGDAMSIYVEDERGVDWASRRATAMALRLQAAAIPFETIPTPAGVATLKIKIGLASGVVRIGILGDSGIGFRTLFAGPAVDAAAAAEHHCRPGDVYADASARLADIDYLRSGLVDPAGSLATPVISARPPRSPAVDRLRVFLPLSLADRLDETGERGIGEHRRCAILFLKFLGIDICSVGASTRLQDFFVAAARSVERLGGMVNKVDTGDKGSKLLILFGAPVAHEDDVRRAAVAALELVELGRQRDLDVRIGFNVGRIFAGIVGSATRREYTAMGDAVNLAARLMERCGSGSILVTEDVARSIYGEFSFGAFEAATFKGKSEAIRVATLAGREVQAAESAARRVLVGRAAELEQVVAWLAGRDGGVISIGGATGVGKTLFVDELQVRLGARSTLCSAASSHGQTDLYGVWHGPVAKAVAELGGAETVARRLTAIDAELARWFGLLDPLLGAPVRQEPPSPDPDVRRRVLWRLLELLFGLLSKGERLAIVLDNLHWADELSRGLLSHLAMTVEPSPFWLLAARGSPLEEGEAERRIAIELGPLAKAEIARLVALETGCRELPAELIERLWNVGAGNPLFSHELLRVLRDEGVVQPDPENPEHLWFDPLRGAELPATLESLFLARFDRLPPQARDFVRKIAVFGERVTWAQLSAVTDPATVERNLHGQDMLRREGDELCFERSLERDVIYQSIDYATRRELHEQIGRGLERSTGADSESAIDLLAHHFYHSGDHPSAAKYLERSAANAVRAFSQRVAAEQYGRLVEAWEAIGDRSRRDKARLELAEVRLALGAFAAATADVQAMLDDAATSDAHRVRGFQVLGELERLAGQPRKARAHFQAARLLATRAGMPEVAFAVKAGIGRTRAQEGDLSTALSAFQAALAEHPDQEATTAGLLCRMNVAMARRYRGELEPALAELAALARAAARRGELSIEFKCRLNRAIFASEGGSNVVARREARAALQLGERCGFFPNLPAVLNLLANLDVARGNLRSARRHYERAQSLYRRLADPAQFIAALGLGRLEWLEGRFAAAVKLLGEGRRGAAAVSQWLSAEAAAAEAGLLVVEFGDSLLRQRLAEELVAEAGSGEGGKALAEVAAALRCDPPDLAAIAFRYDHLGDNQGACLAKLLIAEQAGNAAALAEMAPMIERANDRFLGDRWHLARHQAAAVAAPLRTPFPDLQWRAKLLSASASARGARTVAAARRLAIRLARQESTAEWLEGWRHRLARYFGSASLPDDLIPRAVGRNGAAGFSDSP